ncbi:MAG: hypothetical protein WBO44_06400 [Saprospiraceae bacterium]
MRTRLVVWGVNVKEERVLMAISLNAEANKVEIWSIPEADIPEEFYNKLMSQWREGLDLNMPTSTEHRITELTMADGILPEDLKVEKSDVIQRAQIEWHFIVLSNKLYKNYKTELEDLHDKIKRLESFNHALWEELKQTWSNIQQHIFEKNISRDHADSLREKSNALFDELKKLKQSLASEFKSKSKEVYDQIMNALSEIEQKIESGSLLKPLFDQLVKIQSDLKTQSIHKDHREFISSKLNESFRSIREKREKRESGNDQQGSGADRLIRRYEGLLVAIQKFEQSINFEKKNIDFENRRIATTSGQLEAQIRVAKIKMIEERMKSKEEKLKELLATKEKLELIIEKVKKRDDKQKKRTERKEKVEEEKEKIKAKISDSIHQAQEHVPAELQEKLEKAAEEIKIAKKPKKQKAESKTTEVIPPDSETIASSKEIQTDEPNILPDQTEEMPPESSNLELDTGTAQEEE